MARWLAALALALLPWAQEVAGRVGGRDGAACAEGQVQWPGPPPGFECQDAEAAKTDAVAFLKANMPPWDLINADALAGGVLPATADSAVAARQRYAWAAAVPKDVWQDYVLPYGSVNEARTDWRDLVWQALSPLADGLSPKSSYAQVATALNQHLWSALRPQASPIVFKSQQTPKIYDPMSTIAFGYASCTGISILFVDVLRTFGVPARLVGTPAWHGKEEDGNHNWVEIWLGPGAGLDRGDWAFIEGSPAGGGESLRDPCDKWFCNPSHFDNNTRTYAARFARGMDATVYPMSWDMPNLAVPGVDRTAFYNRVCQRCK